MNYNKILIDIDRDIDLVKLFGVNDIFLKQIKAGFPNTKIYLENDHIVLEGLKRETIVVELTINSLLKEIAEGNEIDKRMLEYYIEIATNMPHKLEKGINSQDFHINTYTKRIVPKTFGQELYIEALRNSDIVFGIGPAGTGKTYLAMAEAVAGLKNKRYARIVLVRPAVEAGENLGFLPGDMKEKVDPYLRPLYDALHDMVPQDKIKKMLEMGIVEVAPLAYMRGRTLNDAFVILDEAQNTTLSQMEMFLTRIGINSKAAITGDITQIDLVNPKKSGLVLIRKILADIEGIEFVYLTATDVLRHPLVRKIVKAFKDYQDSKENKNGNNESKEKSESDDNLTIEET